MTPTGLFVPLITPFTDDGTLAADALEHHAHRVLDDGATGLVALGTTAEPATLTPGERALVLEICARVCAERGAPLIAGAGTNSTTDSLAALTALEGRIAAALTVVPYYTRPSEAGVLAHFRALAAGPVPLIVYNIPYRTGRTLGLDTVLALAAIPGVIGFKHAVGAIDDTTVTMMSRLPGDVAVLAGDDLYAAPMLALGAHGAILACANLAAAAYAELVRRREQGPVESARRLGHRLAAVAETVFAEPNPVVIKAVLAAQGRIPSPAVRMPLLPASDDATKAALRALDALPVR